MKIEAIKEPIPASDRLLKEKWQARKVRLSRTVNRDKEPENREKRDQHATQQNDESSEKEEITYPAVAANSVPKEPGAGLDIIA